MSKLQEFCEFCKILTISKAFHALVSISLQAGSYTESLDLTTMAIKWEEKELGNRPDRMVELYGLMSEIYDEVSGLGFAQHYDTDVYYI